MTAQNRSPLQMAHGALLDLETAKGALEQIESLLFFISTGRELPGASDHIKNLIDIAWNLAAGAANTASSGYESISDDLDVLRAESHTSQTVVRDSEVQS